MHIVSLAVVAKQAVRTLQPWYGRGDIRNVLEADHSRNELVRAGKDDFPHIFKQVLQDV